MSFTCLIDNSTLIQQGKADSRQEWYEVEFECPTCHRSYTERVEFKTQSDLIKSDVLSININGTPYDTAKLTDEDVLRLEREVNP